MNVTSITDYILKLEKENADSRTKIEGLKELYRKTEEERVATLKKLNSLYHTTSRVTEKSCMNQGLVDRLLELGEMTSDFYKTAAYNRGAEILRGLDYEVESGESVMHLKGIGRSIAIKIDEYLEEQDPDYEESVASNDYESDEDSDDEYFVSYNHDIYTMLKDYAKKESNPYKIQAYENAAGEIYYLPFRVTSGKDAMNLPGIGKSIAAKIDEFLKKTTSTNEEVARALEEFAEDLEDPFKIRAYENAAGLIRNLKFEVTSGEELAEGPKKVKGIGKSIARKIDTFLQTGEMN